MILGIGIDSVDIKRFVHWPNLSHAQLLRIFSPQEIEYCLRNKYKSAERFAARFAAREAFFKALGHITTEKQIPFLTLCKKVEVQPTANGAPKLIADWDYIINHTADYFKKLTENTACNTCHNPPPNCPNPIVHTINNAQQPTPNIKTLLSLTHTRTVATAFVILEK